MRAGRSNPLIFVFTMLPMSVILLFSIMPLTFNVTDVFGQLKEGESECTPDNLDPKIQYCCYQHEGNTYCANCYQTSDGLWNCGSFDKISIGLPPQPPGPGKGGPGNVLPEGVLERPETAPSPEGPTELAPQIDCAQNLDDPLCETASIPEAGDQGNGGGGEPEGNEEPQPDEESNSDENGNN